VVIVNAIAPAAKTTDAFVFFVARARRKSASLSVSFSEELLPIVVQTLGGPPLGQSGAPLTFIEGGRRTWPSLARLHGFA